MPRNPPGAIQLDSGVWIVPSNKDQYVVERILAHQLRGKNGKKKLYFLVKWAGYTAEYNTWEPKRNFFEGRGDNCKVCAAYIAYCVAHPDAWLGVKFVKPRK